MGNPSGKDFVIVLNVLQKFIVLKPCWPKKGPTGGCKFAPFAGIVKQTHLSKDFLLLETSNNLLVRLLASCSENTQE